MCRGRDFSLEAQSPKQARPLEKAVSPSCYPLASAAHIPSQCSVMNSYVPGAHVRTEHLLRVRYCAGDFSSFFSSSLFIS